MPEPQQPKTDKDQERRHEYESDRRGEHKYPGEEDKRPSQRERDELKERLERGR